MSIDEVELLLQSHLGFEPTSDQKVLMRKLSAFVLSPRPNCLFVLKGYAGTGKTSMVSALVKALPLIRQQSVLLAPTGRAAKVIANYSGQSAFTIHKKIYHQKVSRDGYAYFERSPNLHKNTVFVVDEASMISTNSGISSSMFSHRDLLEDLLNYVFNKKGCKLILVGDTAQLPPVHMEVSPALDVSHLRDTYPLAIGSIELKEVVRQSAASGILHNATRLREQLRLEDITYPRFELDAFPDCIRITGYELQDELDNAYSTYGDEEVMVVCRSNKQANGYNQQIRGRVRWLEDEVSAGDYMMVVKNNYHWLPDDSKAGFIANGDIIEVLKVVNTVEMYGCRYANVIARLIDYPDEPELETKILLDTITVDAPSLTGEAMKRLYYAIEEDYFDIDDIKKRRKKVMEDSWFNALQVKFAYAVTCHKAQGGQWKAVFVDQGYLTEEMVNKEFLRWLYTAITRTTEKLYLVNFNDRFFEEN